MGERNEKKEKAKIRKTKRSQAYVKFGLVLYNTAERICRSVALLYKRLSVTSVLISVALSVPLESVVGHGRVVGQ